ncbi:MAG: aspartate aminotransferase family protein [Chitinophagales bacterium]
MELSTKQLHEKDQKYYLPTFKRYPLAFKKGSGCYLWDMEDNKYLDVLAGIAVNNVGHCHPKVVKAIQEQAEKLIHISNFYVSPQQVELSEKLTALSGLSRVFLTNSGAESVEGAMKIARKYAFKKGKGGSIIAMENSFHGRTLATIATGKKKYQEGFAPIPEGFYRVPFNSLEAIKAHINNDIAAIILEPVQGEGGIHSVQVEFLKELRELCDKNDILLIFDEIQCGIGRTGKMFAKEHYGVEPDIMTLAKGLGGGTPVGAFLCNEKVARAINFGDHGTTFGGNPLVCAAAIATLNVIEDEKLCENALDLGNWLMEALEKMKTDFPIIKEVRGKGLMIGVELKKPAGELVKMLMEKKILANATADNVLRLVPPLNIKKEELQYLLNNIADCLTEMEKK